MSSHTSTGGVHEGDLDFFDLKSIEEALQYDSRFFKLSSDVHPRNTRFRRYSLVPLLYYDPGTALPTEIYVVVLRVVVSGLGVPSNTFLSSF